MTKSKKTYTLTAKTWPAGDAELLQNAVRRVWDEIGYDCLQATAEDKGKDIEKVTMPRAHVIDVSLDADRWQRWVPKPDAERIRQRMDDTSYKELVKVVTPAFPYRTYGV